jgi:hypothetical protein
MPNTIYLRERLTHRYVDEYRHLDAENYIGEVKMLGITRSVAPRGYDDGGQYHFRVVAPTHLKHLDLCSAIHDTLSHHGCSHEHDCCGCANRFASVKRVSKREYCVRMFVSYNY